MNKYNKTICNDICVHNNEINMKQYRFILTQDLPSGKRDPIIFQSKKIMHERFELYGCLEEQS